MICAPGRVPDVPQRHHRGPRHANCGVVYSYDPEGRIHADNYRRHVSGTRFYEIYERVMQIRNLSDLDAYDALPIRERQRARDELMSSDNRKRMQELRAFRGFIDATGLPVDRATVACLDPPYPDIGCRIDSSPYFFELGEITDEGLARRVSESLKAGKVTVGWHSQTAPLTSILASKAQKAYETDGAPLGLLLYYWKQAPSDPLVQKVLSELRPVVGQMLSSGPFSRIWVYDHHRAGMVRELQP